MLKVSNLHAGYGLVKVLFDVSFEIHEGEIVSLLGSNAAGKTTFVKCLSGVLEANAGEIEFFGESIMKLEPHERIERGLVQVPEGRKIFPTLTVTENLEMGSFIPRAKKERKQKMKEVFEMFPILYEKRNQPAGQLSGGQQQMLAIGRALMAQPRLLVLDEPSLGLAPIVTKQIFQTIYRLNQTSKLTILIIEQNVRAALAMAHRGYVLENGRIVLEGPAQELMGNKQLKEAYLGG